MNRLARLMVLTLSLGAGLAQAMNNQDVLKMSKAGLDEATITAAVRGANPAQFDLSADSIIALKKSGISEPVIQAMISKQNGAGDPPAQGRAKIKFTPVDDSKVLPPATTVEPGNEYYTRYSFKYEDGEHSATNYWRGELVPINTKVKLLKLKKNSFVIQLVESGTKISVENEPDHTKRTGVQVANEMLAGQPTAIDLYGPEMAEAIRTGTLRLGMTKTQVLLARGYPPGHETPSLDGARWKYWSSRFVTHTLLFDGSILAEGRELF